MDSGKRKKIGCDLIMIVKTKSFIGNMENHRKILKYLMVK